MVEWFEQIERKTDCTFICFDIAEFYPSISEELLKKALEWAKTHTAITAQEEKVISNARKSLLFSGGKVWKKKDGSGLFDVTMGSFDGAEVCELVGSFALGTLPERFRTGCLGLYRDDGLGYLRKTTGSGAERVKKTIIKHFKELGLRLTIDDNLKVTNFLDLTLNLNTGTHQPYRKPNDTPIVMFYPPRDPHIRQVVWEIEYFFFIC